MAVSASLLVILTVQAVPTLVSCLAFTSFSPLFFVGSVPFSLLFVTFSVISLASWCWSPHEGVFSADENDAKYSSLCFDCSRVSSKLGNRSWWCCGETPRGLQLAMLFLTWVLLFLLLCLPPMANAEISKVQADVERLPSRGDGQEILEVTLRDLNVEATSQSIDSGGSTKRHEDATSGPVSNNAVEEQISQQSSFDSSVDLYQSEADSPAADGKVELQSCRSLVRAGQQVICAAPNLSPAVETVGSSGLCDCSKESLRDRSSSSCIPDGPIFPSQVEFGQQPLHQRQVAFLTIMNSCNGSRLSLLAAKSDNRQFFVTGFSEKLLAPGETLKFPVCYLPQYLGAARGSITIETSAGPLVVQLEGEGVASLYKMQVRVHEKSHYVISLFNPFNETLFVEEAIVVPEKDDETSEGKKRSSDSISLSTLENEIVIEAEEDCLKQGGETSQSQHGPLMRAGQTWELPRQTGKDIIDFKICLNRGEVFRGSFQIRVTGSPLEGNEITLVYPFSSKVSRPSSVLSVPDALDFGVLVGDQASSQPLVLRNSGEQLVQVEDIYEVPADSKIKIDYKKGHILLPNSETEVANVTYSGLNQPSESSACRKSQKIVVRTNSTIGHLLEIPYTAMVLQCLQSPPTMAFETGSSGRSVGDLGGAHAGQGISDLLMDYKVFMGLLICGLIVGALVFFQVVVHDTELPTLSGDIGKGGCQRRSPFIKKRDKILKMWGWGALATILDGIWTAFGSSLWSKDCNTSSPDYSLPRSVTPAQAPAPSATTPPKSSTGASGASGASGAGSLQAGGRKGNADRKNNGAAKSEQSRNSKGNGETANGGLPVTARDSNHHPPSVKQPKTSKFLRPENTYAKHSICMEGSVDAQSVAKDATVPVALAQEIEPIQAIAPAQSTGPMADSSIKESPKHIASTHSSVPVAQKASSPCAPPVEREKRKRRKKSGRHDVASNLGTSGGVSPASPASPVTPSHSTWPVSPSSSDKKSDQSTASLSPRSLGSVDLADAAPLPKLKVKVLNSLKVTNPAPATSVTQSPRRGGGAASAPLQPRLQGKAAEHRKQSPLERGGGPGAGKKSNISEWAAIARKKTPSTGFSKGLESGDGSHSHRSSRHPHQRVGNNAFAGLEDGHGGAAAASFTTSASFPRLSSRGSRANSFDFGADFGIDTSVVPPPGIAPALRAPGAKITKQAPTGEPSWTSLGITASPELLDGRIDREALGGSTASWHSSASLSGQSSGELVYDIWGNHFGNLSQCSSNSDPSFQPVLEKEVDPVNSFHRLLVPEHLQQSEVSFSGTTGFVGDMSPTAAALYATHFKGFFSEGSTLGFDDSRPASPASVHDLPDQLYPSDGAGSLETSKLGFVGGQAFAANHVKPRVRVPYSPPMGCLAATAFSTSAFSPLGTPTHALSSTSSASKHSFWAHDNSSLPERVVSPTLSLS